MKKYYNPKLNRDTVIILKLSPRENGKMYALLKNKRKHTRIIRGFKK